MKKYIFILFIFTLGMTNCQESFDKRLQREAKEFTAKHCPEIIETGNTLDSASYDITSRTYTRWYTLEGNLDTPQAHSAALMNIDILKAQLVNELCSNTHWNTCRKQNIKFSYIYHSKLLQKELFRITITSYDYSY